MTPDKNWSFIENDHVKPFFRFEVSEDERLKETFNWKNKQTLIKQIHLKKITKFDFLA